MHYRNGFYFAQVFILFEVILGFLVTVFLTYKDYTKYKILNVVKK